MTAHIQRRLVVAAGLVIIALTGVAFWLSYAHLAEIAGAHGLSGERAWAWPATLDAFIVAGELLMLRAALRHRTDWWAVSLTVAGSGGSIALNVWGVGNGADAIDYVVAGVPPTAALLAFGALMRQIHQHYAETAPAVKPETETVETETTTRTAAMPVPVQPRVSPPTAETETAPEVSIETAPPVPTETPRTETKPSVSPRGAETGLGLPASETGETNPARETHTETGETETAKSRATETVRSATRLRPGAVETETQTVLDLLWDRDGQVSLADAITETGRPKATAAKRLKHARELHASGVRRIRTAAKEAS